MLHLEATDWGRECRGGPQQTADEFKYGTAVQTWGGGAFIDKASDQKEFSYFQVTKFKYSIEQEYRSIFKIDPKSLKGLKFIQSLLSFNLYLQVSQFALEYHKQTNSMFIHR